MRSVEVAEPRGVWSWRLGVLVLVMAGLFAFDILVPPVVVLPFVCVPVVVAAVWEPSRMVAWLAGLSVLMAVISGLSNDYFSSLNDVLWMLAMVAVGLVAVVGARARERVQEQREATGGLLRATLDAEFDPHVVLEALRDGSGQIVDFTYVEANPAACEYNKVSREQLIGARLLELLPGHSGSGLLASYREVVETGKPLVLNDFAYEQELLGGQLRWYDVRGVKIGDGISYAWRDVTDRYEAARALRQSEERYRLLAQNSSDVVLHTRDEVVLWVSPSVATVLGWQPDDWIGHRLEEFVNVIDLQVIDNARSSIQSGGAAVLRVRVMDASGVSHWVEVHSQVYRDATGKPDGYQSSFRVVDKEVQNEIDLARRAAYDDLTGALKRDPALQRLRDIGEHPRSPSSQTAVLFVDVDAFKHVNDTYGHAAGDALLGRIGEVMHESVRSGDTIARMGGDEFLVILPGMHNLDEATAIAGKIHAACAQPITLREGNLEATVSIGVALSDPGEGSEDLVARADHAMYTAKKAGGNQVVAVSSTTTHAA